MATEMSDAFAVEVADDGSVIVRGEAAVTVLLRLVMAAKFQTELNAEHLLSPYVNQLLKELTRVSPVEAIDWGNPAVAMPPSFLEAVQVVREYRDQHQRGRDLQELLHVALSPFDPPPDRLGLA